MHCLPYMEEPELDADLRAVTSKRIDNCWFWKITYVESFYGREW